MVEISEIMEEDPQPQAPVAAATADTDVIGNGVANAADARAQERLRDAEEIEAALSANHIARPSARLHVENLITKLRKEGAALQRVAASSNKNKADSSEMEMEPDAAKVEPTKPTVASVPKRSPAHLKPNPGTKYQSFPTHYFDLGGYSSATVSVYVPLEGVGRHDRAKISCHFTASSFDLVVTDYNKDGAGETKSYRLLNSNLDKDIVPDKSKYVVKPNKIIIKLGKVKGEYGFDSWTDLSAKKKKNRDASGKSKKDDNPTAGIMDMMKDMYDSGDDNMKKMIGETMMKQRTGQLDKPGMPGGMPGMDGLGDLGMGM